MVIRLPGLAVQGSSQMGGDRGVLKGFDKLNQLGPCLKRYCDGSKSMIKNNFF